jgi:hypothetical protein
MLRPVPHQELILTMSEGNWSVAIYVSSFELVYITLHSLEHQSIHIAFCITKFIETGAIVCHTIGIPQADMSTDL